MSNAWTGILAFVGLLLANGFFVGAEFAVIAARRAQIEPRAEAGSKPAKLTIKGMENVSLILATCQLGVTISGLMILLVAEPSIHELLKAPLSVFGLDHGLEELISFGVTLVIVSFLHVLIGEMVPKNISFSIPERAALVLVPMVYGLAILMKPVVMALNSTANGFLRIFGVRAKNEANTAYTIEQVESIVQHSTREGVLSDATGAISNTFEFTDKKVKDILVPLEKLITFTTEVTPREIEQAVSKYGFSRYIILNAEGSIEGYVHLKDVIDSSDQEVDKRVERRLIRSVNSIPGETELEDALAQMQKSRQHLISSVDQAGKTMGILFLEDILEELVGEVQDATRRD